MQVLGILVRTKTDAVTELSFSHANQIIEVARAHGHILIDVAAEVATRDNLHRILDSVGTPTGNFLKIILFYSHGNDQSPLDQDKLPFITDEVLSKFRGWGVYCLGSNVGQTLGHRLLEAGATFVIAFSSNVTIPLQQPSKFFDSFNAGIIRMLKEGVSPSLAANHMRDLFLTTSKSLISATDIESQILGVFLNKNAEGLRFNGHELLSKIQDIKPGRNDAAEYQLLVSQLLHEIFDNSLSAPRLEVTNSSGTSRYDIFFSTGRKEVSGMI